MTSQDMKVIILVSMIAATIYEMAINTAIKYLQKDQVKEGLIIIAVSSALIAKYMLIVFSLD